MFARLAGFFIIPLVWFLAADIFSLANPALLPPASGVINRLYSLAVDGTIVKDLLATVVRWLSGLCLGVIAGTIVGLLVGLSPRLRKLTEFPVEFMRALPVTAIFPLFLIVFGIGDGSKVAMAFTPTFLLMLVNTSYGVTLADPTRRKMARVFGANSWQLFRYVVTMDALPQIFIGLRLSVSLSLIVTVVSEMFIGTDLGLGQRIYDSYLTNSVTTLYALLIVLGVVGFTVNKSLLFVESKLIFWTGR